MTSCARCSHASTREERDSPRTTCSVCCGRSGCRTWTDSTNATSTAASRSPMRRCWPRPASRPIDGPLRHPSLASTPPPNDQGQRIVLGVVPGSAAERAGLQRGDVLVKVGDVAVRPNAERTPEYRARYRGRAGQPLTLVVQRNGQTLNLATTVQERTATTFAPSLAPLPSAKQARLWKGLATGSTGG